ncbi:MAG: S49 family peptidase [Vicinamibacterales bacterium]
MTHETSHPLAAYFQTRPIAVEKTRLPELLEHGRTMVTRLASLTPAQVDAAVQAAAELPLGRMVGAVAVLPIRGVITQKADFYSWFFGGTSVERLVASFRHYQNDPAVSAIVFDVDSPGGEVYGLQEGFAELFAGRDQKKTFAIVNPFMASAAYFLGCAAERVWMTPSGQVGSIGCYTLHVDLSEMLKQAGVTATFIKYGQHKVDGNPYEPLSADARDDLQEMVDFYGREFDAAVAQGRGVTTAKVRAEFGQGRMFRAPDAKRIGLVDRIGTRDELLASLAPPRSRGFSALAPAEDPTAVAAVAGAETADSASVAEDPQSAPDDGDEQQRQRDADALAVALALTEV